MSHIVEIQTEVRDAEAVHATCRRLELPAPVHGTRSVYITQATGLAVQLPGWRYPVVCDTAAGRIQYDNYSGRWAEREELNRFLQAYAVEKSKLEARRNGHAVYEQPLADGSIKLTVQVAGGAS